MVTCKKVGKILTEKIITFSDELREVSEIVEDFDGIEHLIEVMKENIGVGVSAIQLGVPKQVMIIQVTDPVVIINPVIEEISGDILMSYEGCLSLPNIFALVERPNQVTVSYVNEKNEPQNSVFADFEAGVFLHEYDHLNGTIFVDRCYNRGDRRNFERKFGMKVIKKEGY